LNLPLQIYVVFTLRSWKQEILTVMYTVIILAINYIIVLLLLFLLPLKVFYQSRI